MIFGFFRSVCNSSPVYISIGSLPVRGIFTSRSVFSSNPRCISKIHHKKPCSLQHPSEFSELFYSLTSSISAGISAKAEKIRGSTLSRFLLNKMYFPDSFLKIRILELFTAKTPGCFPYFLLSATTTAQLCRPWGCCPCQATAFLNSIGSKCCLLFLFPGYYRINCVQIIPAVSKISIISLQWLTKCRQRECADSSQWIQRAYARSLIMLRPLGHELLRTNFSGPLCFNKFCFARACGFS